MISSYNSNTTKVKFMKKIEQIVKQIQDSKIKMVIALTGGGSETIPMLLRGGGSSSCLIEAIVPYDQAALTRFLKKTPQKYCSEQTACMMASAALDIATKNDPSFNPNDPNEPTLIGVGMTCSLKKAGERKDREHWVHIAICSLIHTECYSFILNNAAPLISSDKELSVRLRQENEASELLLRIIVNNKSDLEKYIKRTKTECYSNNSVYIDDITDNKIKIKHEAIYPGSFDPMHLSHREIIKAASELTNKKVTAEISLSNVDKPRTDLISARNRINSIRAAIMNFDTYQPEQLDVFCVLTEAPLFKDKIKLFKNATFIIGYDTYNRLDKSIRNGETDLEDLEGVKFLVFHRNGYEINKTSELSLLCEFVPHEIYYDTHARSSTKIRNGKI